MHTVDWLIILSFVVCWPIAGYLFWHWDLGGYRSEYEIKKEKDKKGKT